MKKLLPRQTDRIIKLLNTRSKNELVTWLKKNTYRPDYEDPKVIKKFRAKIRMIKDKCWEWQGTLNNGGYGVFVTPIRTISAHRFMTMVDKQKEIPPKVWALHKCDNRGCCNPRHLYWGTAKDNARDRWGVDDVGIYNQVVYGEGEEITDEKIDYVMSRIEKMKIAYNPVIIMLLNFPALTEDQAKEIIQERKR